MAINKTYAGGAALAKVSGVMTPSTPGVGQTFTVDTASGWPTTDPTVAVIDRGLSTEEKILISSITGTTFTVSQRGYDGTSAQSHADQATCELAFDALALVALVDHVDGNEANPHDGVLLDSTDHADETLHQFGSGLALGLPAAGITLDANKAASAGTGNNPAREDHVHDLTTGTPGTILPDSSAASGSAAALSRADHQHAIAAAAAGAITGSVGEGVSTSFARADHDHGYGAGSVDTAAIADLAITMAKLASETSVDWSSTLSLTGVTLGTGGSKYAHYWKFGRLVLMLAGFELGSGGSVSATIQFSLPFTPLDLAGFSGSNAGGGFTAGTARDSSTQQRHSGIGAIRVDLDTATDYVVAGQSIGWATNTPFTWTNGDTLEIIAVFEEDPA